MTDRRAYLPPDLTRRRAWGLALNLYGLRSARNWGIGDFTDLCEFVRMAADAGAGVVGINPLHALHLMRPEAPSPYAPSSRFFLNPLYIDVTAIEHFNADLPAAAALRARVASVPFADTLAALRASPYVAYARVARAKLSALEACYEIFRARGTGRDAFERFAGEGGERLERFALYQTLTEHFVRGPTGGPLWTAWPSAFRDPESSAVRAFATRTRRRIDYFKYVQWIAHEQLNGAARAATRLALGLYLDVAVGVDLNSADAWSYPNRFVLNETIGAPPDALGPLGQNWGLPPPDVTELQRDGGAEFVALLRANMAHAKVLRLDHVMSLQRLFRIPRGHQPSAGAYVAYPFDELVALVTAESRRAECVVVGEDLGNVPEGFRDRMNAEGILSYRVLLFERNDDGRFTPPQDYPALALATGTTHDLATLPGWIAGRDIAMRDRLGITSDEATARARRERRTDVTLLCDALVAHGDLLPRDAGDVAGALHDSAPAVPASAFVRAAYRYLASTPARIVLLALDDVLGELDQINVPGTHGEYPNWRRKHRVDLGAMAPYVQFAAEAVDVRTRTPA